MPKPGRHDKRKEQSLAQVQTPKYGLCDHESLLTSASDRSRCGGLMGARAGWREREGERGGGGAGGLMGGRRGGKQLPHFILGYSASNVSLSPAQKRSPEISPAYHLTPFFLTLALPGNATRGSYTGEGV
ncbi:hypothetical protein BaRGS_00002895 [Batillaria attramentaria]|uniref:Uncharacterized protein n=1 Tax=Batillaria attramentaria TaxID=370345 RepID=A0ABD0M127_9CAEN